MAISDDRRAAQAKWGKAGLVIAGACVMLIIVLFLLVPSGTPAGEKAIGTVEKLTVDDNTVNVAGTVSRADDLDGIVPAIGAIAEAVRERSEPKGANMTRLPVPVDQNVLMSIKLKQIDGTEMDFGNITIPLMRLYTAPAGNPLNLLDLATDIEAGTGPGIGRVAIWCRLPENAAQAPKFCEMVEVAS